MPTGTFTVEDVQKASGASAAVVRGVIGDEVPATRGHGAAIPFATAGGWSSTRRVR